MEFEQAPYGVYIKADDKGRITSIHSSAFLSVLDGLTKIDEGFGDKYHHAQGNYLPKGLMDDRGIWRYKLVNGKPVERTQEEMDADYVEPEAVISDAERMEQIEYALIETAAIQAEQEQRQNEVEAALIELASLLTGGVL